jgi:anaerobic magnesium-protoporphyrin IX monomethyl ester cyclase
MAKIAIIKLFNGLNLAPAQLAGQLLKAGHEVKVIYFKETLSITREEAGEFQELDYAGGGFLANGENIGVDLFKPVSALEEQNLVAELKAFQPDCIGFTVFSGLIGFAAEVNEKLRKYFDVPYIWGGPGPTLEPEKCIDYAEILCINEGEAVIVELANCLDAGKPYTNIAGTWAKQGDEIIKNETPPLMEIDDLAHPDWSPENNVFINRRKVVHNYYPESQSSTYSIMTQRGCPFSCAFCIESRYQDLFGRKNSLRRKSIDLIMEELHWAKDNLDLQTVMFYDDVFTVHPRWLEEFLPRYKEEIGLPFWCYTYPTTHDRALLEKLKDAGCVAITMGVQSGSERILKEHFNRPTKSNRVIEAAQEIIDVGITAFFDMITKVDFETIDDLEETFEFLLRLPIEMNTFMLAEMTSYPTYRYSEDVIAAEAAGTLRKPSDEDYDFYHNLYLLTRSTQPESKIREIRNDPKYRDNPTLMKEFFDHTPVINFTDPIPRRERRAG